MRRGIWTLAGFVLAYPAFALLTVYAAMAAGAWAVFSTSPAIPPALIPLAVAVGGTIGSLPLILLGRWGTGNATAALTPTVLTVTMLTGLTLIYALPPLHPLLGQAGHLGMINHLMLLAMGFQALAAAIYLAGICRLLLALRRPLA